MVGTLARSGLNRSNLFRRVLLGSRTFSRSAPGTECSDSNPEEEVRKKRRMKGDVSSERLNIMSLESLAKLEQKRKKNTEGSEKPEISNAPAAAAEEEKAEEELKKKREAPEQPGAWKWAYRKRVWDHFQLRVFRFPYFEGARKATDQLWRIPEFRSANCVYVSIDTPLRLVRVLLLKNKKQMLVSRLPKELFSLLDPNYMSVEQIKQACQQAEFRIEGKPIGLNDQGNVQVDIIVIGSVAVDPLTGARLGKGDGYAEYEYAMLRYLGAVDDTTLVVTTVHDDQLLEDLPAKLLQSYDLPVDVICTPTQIIRTNKSIRKPTEILWNHIMPEKLRHLPFLKQLKEKIEKETGEPVYLAKFKNRRLIDWFPSAPAIFITNINPSTTEDELKEHLASLKVENGSARVFRTSSTKAVGRVIFPKNSNVSEIDKFIAKINNSKLKEWTIKARRDLRDDVKQLANVGDSEKKPLSAKDEALKRDRDMAKRRMLGM